MGWTPPSSHSLARVLGSFENGQPGHEVWATGKEIEVLWARDKKLPWKYVAQELRKVTPASETMSALLSSLNSLSQSVRPRVEASKSEGTLTPPQILSGSYT